MTIPFATCGSALLDFVEARAPRPRRNLEKSFVRAEFNKLIASPLQQCVDEKNWHMTRIIQSSPPTYSRSGRLDFRLVAALPQSLDLCAAAHQRLQRHGWPMICCSWRRGRRGVAFSLGLWALEATMLHSSRALIVAGLKPWHAPGQHLGPAVS